MARVPAQSAASLPPQAQVKSVSLGQHAWQRLCRNKLAVAGGSAVLLLAVLALGADVVAPYHYTPPHFGRNFAFPSREFVLGTDHLGRDVLSRIIYGARVSMTVGVVAESIVLAIGVASRQELEEVTAVHASRATEVEAARQRLLLLGLSRAHVEALTSPSQVVSDVVVPAPIAGVMTGRTANLGQVVSMGQELFVVTDLSQVWVIGDLYEQDFQTVHVGSEAALTTPAYPHLTLRGRVSYIDPRVDPQTRTAKVRVEVPNAEGHLRLGMYVTLAFTTPGRERVVVVPRAAVQTIDERQVVFVPAPDEEGKFLPRPVQVGPLRGDRVTIRSGVQPGEVVVTEGSFFLRAELLRNAPSSS